MNNIFQYVNVSLSNELSLNEIKDNLSTYLNEDVIKYCNDNATYINNKHNKIKLHDYSNDLFETILICWDDGSESKIHDHPENGCILQLLNGCLEEYLYDSNLKLQKISTFNSGDISYMENSIGYHKIKCINKAISLHIYSPSNYIMTVLDR